MQTDTELLARYTQARDREALNFIIDRHAAKVFATCLRVLNDVHAAEDAAQAVFLIFLQKAPSFGSSVVVSAWLYRTAEFVARSQRQRQVQRARHEKSAGLFARQISDDRGIQLSENAAA